MSKSKYIRHTGTKQLAKILTKKLVEECIGKSPEECAELEAAFLKKISKDSEESASE